VSIMNNAVFIQIPGEPVPFARAGALGKRRFTPKKQSDFMGVIKLYAQRAMKGDPPFEGPLRIVMRATYLVPQSWSEKKKANSYWKQTKPDADNLYKLFADAAEKICFLNDSQISEVIIQKVYGPIAHLTVEISELSDDRQHRNISL